MLKNAAAPPDPEPLPFASSEFAEAWADWERHRSEIGKRLKPTARKSQLKKLAEMGEQRAIETLKHSTVCGWTGLFEPDSKPMANGHARDVMAEMIENGRRFIERGQRNDAG